MKILRSVYQNLIDHCSKEFPRQACGMLIRDGNYLVKHIPMKNAGAWPYGFQFDPYEQMQEMKQIMKDNLSLGAVYHVHLTSRAYPTSKDVIRHYYKDALCMIVSLLNETKVELCSYLISDFGIIPTPLEVIDRYKVYI